MKPYIILQYGDGDQRPISFDTLTNSGWIFADVVIAIFKVYPK